MSPLLVGWLVVLVVLAPTVWALWPRKKPRLYVLATNTFGMKRWLAEDGSLVSVPQRAHHVPLEQAERLARVPTCSPIIDWIIEDAV